MLKKPDKAFSLRSETQRTEAYASPLRSLRPCWMAFLSIPRGVFPITPDVQSAELQLQRTQWVFCVLLRSARRLADGQRLLWFICRTLWIFRRTQRTQVHRHGLGIG